MRRLPEKVRRAQGRIDLELLEGRIERAYEGLKPCLWRVRANLPQLRQG
jgi:hypothetical protein